MRAGDPAVHLSSIEQSLRLIATVPGQGCRVISTSSNAGWHGGSETGEGPRH
ncbi:MAG: hypothetical protein ACP5VP_10300 [Candidatus Limnocylindrales bacterium]